MAQHDLHQISTYLAISKEDPISRDFPDMNFNMNTQATGVFLAIFLAMFCAKLFQGSFWQN